MKQGIIQPKQERSIKKRNQILEAGFQLISKEGYHKTNTAQIAKAAGVSTGIVYRYFEDKHDILIQAIKLKSDPLFEEINYQLQQLNSQDQIEGLLRKVVFALLDYHDYEVSSVRELKALLLTDEECLQYMKKLEAKTCKNIADALVRIGYDVNHVNEKAFIIWYMIDAYCDNYSYAEASGLNSDYISSQVITMIKSIVSGVK